MGTIIGRTRKDGTTAYLAQILLKRKGQIVHREAQTFDRKQAAKAWLARRETELSDPGAFDRKNDVKLADVIDRYVRGRPVDDAYWARVATPTLIVSGERARKSFGREPPRSPPPSRTRSTAPSQA